MKELSNVIIIGNGSSLLGRSLGSIIDSHEQVLRFNEFKTVGFEADVGTKTTIWFYHRDTEHPRVIGRIPSVRPTRMFVHEWNVPDTAPLLLQAAIERLGSGTQVMRVKKQILADMTIFAEEKYTMWSSGAIATWLLLQETGRVTLAGFDWWHKPAKHHYMNGQTFHHLSDRGHQPKIEKRFYDRLAETGRLHFLYE